MKHYVYPATGEMWAYEDDGSQDHLIQAGMVQVNDADLLILRTPPTPSHVFDWANRAWIDMRPLAEQQDAKWEKIKAAREASIDAPLATPFGLVDCKAKDRTNITDSVLLVQTLQAIGQPSGIDFTMADNTTVTLTATEMVTIGLLLGQKVQQAHATARALRIAIYACISAAEVGAIEWPNT